jgi:hypothetical protein
MPVISGGSLLMGRSLKMQVAGGQHGEAAESAAMAGLATHEIQIV